MEDNEFGNYVKGIRKTAGITLLELQNQSGVSQPYLSNIENGKRGIPTPDILNKIAGPLGVSYAHLMHKAGYWNDSEVQEDAEIDLSSLKDTRTVIYGHHILSEQDKALMDNFLKALVQGR